MNSSRYFFYYITLWCCYYTAEVQSWKQKPLIFDYGTEQLMDINDNDNTAKCTSCITACPVFSRFVQEASISGQGLILQQIYRDEGIPKKIPTNICDKTPTPSIIFDTMEENYVIGYELFYKEAELTLSFKIYEELNKVIDGEPNPENRVLVDNNFIKTYYDQGNTKFEVQGIKTETMVFYWIAVLTVELNPSTHLRTISFSKDVINDHFHKEQVTSQCENYYISVGSQISSLRRESIFNWLLFKKQTDENRLEKTQILPMHMLHTLPGRLATCMYANVAFIWSSVANGQLQKVDLLLYTLYKLWPSNISINFGVAGELEGINPELLAKENKLFLKYPVPKIMYRTVEWAHKTGFIHKIIIVVHNDPNPIPQEDQICSAVDEVLGWDEITSITDTGTTTGTSYTCHMSQEVMDKIGFERQSVMEPFSLTHFPKIDESDKNISYTNVQKEVLAEFNRLKNLKK